MKQHSKSLLTSIFVHVLLVAFALYSVKTVSSSLGRAKEKTVCIKLGSIVEVAQTSKQVQKKEKKKPLQPKQKKVVSESKKIVKKRVPLKQKKIIRVKENQPLKEEVVATQELKKVLTEQTSKVSRITKDTQATTTQQKESSQSKYRHRYIDEIVKLLQENLYYPRRARKKGVEGEVSVRFSLDCNAKVSEVRVVSSSSELLSHAAVKTIEALSGEFPKPQEDLILTIPISYHLH
ncbi:TonB family protein [Sulfurimonas sp.]